MPSSDSASGSNPSLAERTRPLEPGHRLANGRLVVERLLAQGGMACVYAAWDHARMARVALKTLQLREPSTRYRLKREFRVLRDLSHRNLIRLHELFLEEELCYFTMDLVVGTDFLSYVREPGTSGAYEFNEARVRASLAQLVIALGVIHNAGKVHRDVKPTNVVVEDSGRLVLLDFGLAFDQYAPDDPDLDSGFLGTPAYMAPEVFRGESRSNASDWYSVGLMLYEALVGALPFGTNRAKALWSSKPFDPPSSLNSKVPQDLDELTLALLAASPAKRPDGAALLALLGAQEPSSLPPVSTGRPGEHLVGRDEQLAELHRALNDSRHTGHPIAVFLTGASGMGKTSLLARFVRETSKTATVLAGSCSERESVPHKALDAVVDALVRLLLDLPTDEVIALVKPDEAVYLAQLFEIVRRVPALAWVWKDETRGDPHHARRRAYEALAQVLARLGQQRPLIIAIDDMHWGDVDSARLLYELFAGPTAPLCLLILTYRDSELIRSDCLRALLEGERCLPDLLEVREIHLTPLSEGDSETLVRSVLSGAGLEVQINALQREAGGSPLLLSELALHIRGRGNLEDSTFDLKHLVAARLLQISPQAQRLFDLVCVARAPLSEAVARKALALEGLAEAVIELENMRLLRERASLSPDAIEVFHSGIREVRLGDISDVALRAMHRALARAYEEVSSSKLEAVAWHYAGAQDAEQATLWAERAGVDASRRLAFDRAAHLFELALQNNRDPERAQRLELAWASALADIGRAAQAAPLFFRCAERAAPIDALRLQQRAAEQWLVSGHLAEGLRALGALADAVGLRMPTTPRRALIQVLSIRAWLSVRGLKFNERKEEEVPPGQLLKIDACRSSWALGFVSTVHGAAVQARFLSLALDCGEPVRVALGLGMESIHRSSDGAIELSNSLRARAHEIARVHQDPHLTAFCQLVDGQCDYLQGKWATAQVALENAERLFVERRRAATWELNSTRFFLSNALVYLGRLRELRRRMRPWLSDAVDRGDRYAHSGLRLVRARSLYLATDEADKAAQEIDAALSEWPSEQMGVHRFLAEIAKIQLALYRGDIEGGRARAARLWPQVSGSLMSRSKLCRITTHQHSAWPALAAAEATRGREQARHLKAARHHMKLLEREEQPWATAYARYVQAVIAYHEGNLASARLALEGAVESLDSCNMSFYAAAVRYRLGQLNLQDGAALREQAFTSLRLQGVLRPDRFTAMLAPGFTFPEAEQEGRA